MILTLDEGSIMISSSRMSEEPPFSLASYFYILSVTTDWLSVSIMTNFLPVLCLLPIFVATEIVGYSTYLSKINSTTTSSVKLLIASSLEKC